MTVILNDGGRACDTPFIRQCDHFCAVGRSHRQWRGG
jgi:hypothetical protein